MQSRGWWFEPTRGRHICLYRLFCLLFDSCYKGALGWFQAPRPGLSERRAIFKFCPSTSIQVTCYLHSLIIITPLLGFQSKSGCPAYHGRKYLSMSLPVTTHACLSYLVRIQPTALGRGYETTLVQLSSRNLSNGIPGYNNAQFESFFKECASLDAAEK